MLKIVVSALSVLVLTVPSCVPSRAASVDWQVEWRSLDGSRNNLAHPDWGKAGTAYLRVGEPNYADGIGGMAAGPPSRYISNRVFNDVGQNVFAENGISQWGWIWGQFLDHTFGLRDERPGESGPIPFDTADPLERFTDDLGAIDFARTPAAPGTNVDTRREQTNTVSSYIDAFAVYGGTARRLEWLRDGPANGTVADNDASLLLPGGYLPRASSRGDVSSAPAMDTFGRLVGNPGRAVVAGDVRANENIALTAVHTLFAREHNRIVSLLPDTLSEEDKFEIARRVVGAEQQYVTYNEFLPALGVHLSSYTGYDPNVNASLANEFATVGYRVHSMVHGEFEPEVPSGYYSPRQLSAFEAQGIEVENEGGNVRLVIPLDLAFGNPDLLRRVGLEPLLKGFATERQYKNDEQIDDALRSILFQMPKPEAREPSACGLPVVNPDCFRKVQDLGAIDVERGRDHGMPSYNELREAYGLAPKTSYAAITSESTDSFPDDPSIDENDPIDDPDILDFTTLEDDDGAIVRPGGEEAEEDVAAATRRTTLAARLRGVYGDGNVDEVDAFVGMLSEPHVPGTQFGELQLAIWTQQFEALRDGDRFFYLNDPVLAVIKQFYGIDHRQTLAAIINANTGIRSQPDVFTVPVDAAEQD
jgi:Animal haem peroxidase